jgi:hypothetical protein
VYETEVRTKELREAMQEATDSYSSEIVKTIPMRVAEAMDRLKEEYGKEKLLARGFDFISHVVRMKRVRGPRALRQSPRMEARGADMEILYDFLIEQDEPATFYAELLIFGYVGYMTTEDMNRINLEKAKSMIKDRISAMERFYKDGPAPAREHFERNGFPNSYYELRAIAAILDDIKL